MIEQRRQGPERTIAVGAYDSRTYVEGDRLLDELCSLISAAGGYVVGRSLQRRIGPGPRGIHASTYIGRGKAEAIGELASAHEATLVVFDNELSPAQIRELEKLIGCRVIDRSELILDIFAARARTREAKIQVELAQLQYTAPRLRGMWTHLERQAGGGGGGIGSRRGPGEKQIEIDRRIISSRLARLRSELESLHGRKQREVSDRVGRHFCVGLVGYTNAGKSTLMNRVTGAGTYAADQLFATLDTKTRKWRLPSGVDVMLSDTVGFVRDLPHQLVASFRATLEEALTADLLLHVVDASHPAAEEQIATVEAVLDELGVQRDRLLNVLNKVDRIENDDDLAILRARFPHAVAFSAQTGEGLSELEAAVLERFREVCAVLSIAAPHDSGALQSFVRRSCALDYEEYVDDGWRARVTIPEALVSRLRDLCPDATITRVD